MLQHPLEQHHSKGTVRLLQLALQHCRVWVGEVFDAELLAQALDSSGPTGCSTCLLYPPEADSQTQPLRGMPMSADAVQCDRLVVLDATWRKSRKMLHLNPLLRQLPRLSLSPAGPSRYAIRKAQQASQLSTLEAVVMALQDMQGAPPEQLAALLEGFDGFVAQQARESASR